VRAFVIPCCRLVFALAGIGALSASAEMIRLKNGAVIYADQVRDEGNKVRYEIGDDTYSIPKSLVKSIDVAAPIPRVSTSNAAPELPAYTPTIHAGGEEQLLGEVIRGGEVNRESLSTIESRGDPAQTAVAFYIAARHEFEAGKYHEARRDFESALHYDPQNPAVLNYYAALLVRTGSARDALAYAERATRLAPDSADAFAVLGYAQYAADRARDAIQSWKHSLALRPDVSIQHQLVRAQRETTAENGYTERETGHFLLRYEGGESSESFRGQILSTLESEFRDLAGEFGVEPRSSIQVVLYNNQNFFDVTQSPSWTGALNDGKLRIPLQGLNSVTPELTRILKHELAHSFVNQLSMGRCPHWLNEGIAQALEPKSLGSHGARLAEMFKLNREIPLNQLEGRFSSFSGMEAALAYDESLATVQYLLNTYGMSELLRILEKLGHGEAAEAALRSSIHGDYRQLQGEVATYLVREFQN
jgi:tetratricopeptide (TPR) repeat protein